ncbi:ArsR/SmtB family transcription factor [Pontivivens ytuae]|uniref:Helix-turn-helix transcriptional regulator n=1 Tax=Pontivivens ytuae TaxID=2789856 RepID=A0A7S9LSK7_9RHOB|nr:metalloregulator ArsR/SmtB family transcription factor [Pontivivens ytuae]QPH54462.1 helix-turn-helix transcriptional regulator [Pontivivens ytuae]
MANLSQNLDAIFRALADPTRREVLALLEREPASVKTLAARFDMALPSFLAHVKLLEEAGLIETEKVGRVRSCAIRSDGLRAAERWLRDRRRFIDERLDALGDFLADETDGGDDT